MIHECEAVVLPVVDCEDGVVIHACEAAELSKHPSTETL